MNILNQIGSSIVRLRTVFDLTQQELAINCNIDRRYLSDIENGKRNVSILILEKITSYLGLSLTEFFRYSQKLSISSLDELKTILCEEGFDESIVLENPDYLEAVIGISEDGRVIYDYDLMPMCLMIHDKISREEAIEFIEFNTIRALPYMGEGAPIILKSNHTLL